MKKLLKLYHAVINYLNSLVHYFHNECIDFWLAKSSKCPVCKNRCDE